MEKIQNLSKMTVDEILDEAVRRERKLMSYYTRALGEVGPDARSVVLRLLTQHAGRITMLEDLHREITDQREITVAIAD